MSADSYISCASCHLDGGHDGRVWHFTGRGEGLRRTTDLRGRSGMGHGNVHWTGNFDEIQDFEHDIRRPVWRDRFPHPDAPTIRGPAPSPATGKAGLSADLDALAAYVATLSPAHVPAVRIAMPTAPSRRRRSVDRRCLPPEIVLLAIGATRYQQRDLAVASPSLSNTGAQSLISGSRLGQTLSGIDTPTLHGLHATRLYPHHGQAATLTETFRYAGELRDRRPRRNSAEAGRGQRQSRRRWRWILPRRVWGNSAYLTTESTASVRFTNVDGGSGGPAQIAFRYARQYSGGTATLVVNGVFPNHYRLPPDAR